MNTQTAINRFGFSTAPNSGGDYTPIVKYDARAGRMFRVDRVQGADGFSSNPVDITQGFRAVFDFENFETGWIDFPTGSAPSFVLMPLSKLAQGQSLPPAPSPKHKPGVRVLIKLAKTCGGDQPVREIAGVSKSFLGGIEAVFAAYETEREKNKAPDGSYQLPVISLVSTTPVTSGNGAQKSTNYHPLFRIDGWVKRPEDLIFIQAATQQSPHPQAQAQAPSTGGTPVPPPVDFGAAPKNLADDFG